MAEKLEFVCQIDERAQDEEGALKVKAQGFVDRAESLARELIEAREYLSMGLFYAVVKKYISDRISLLAFACEHPSRKVRTPVDVKKMVDTWAPLVKKLALAHDIDERDAADSALDEHLTPILAAPVAQIREFYRGLTARLKADKEIPFALWMLFEYWGANVLDKIQKEEVIGLKTELAKRIAERSFEMVPTEDWVKSMIGALQWREPEKLKEVEKALDAGAKPRVRGKQSCLFLQVGEAEVML